MANKDAAFGFRPVRHLTGGLIRTNEYKIAANYGTSIYMGTPVLAVTAGGIEIADDSSGTPSVILGILADVFILILRLVSQHLAIIIQQAQMLLILLHRCTTIQESSLKFSMTELAQQL